MKTIYTWFVAAGLIFQFFLFPLPAEPEVKNPDRPLKGKWNFKPEHVWTIDEAGDDSLARPRALLVSDNGTVYVYDPKNRKNYIFNNEGQFIKSFARRGEGPGEVAHRFRLRKAEPLYRLLGRLSGRRHRTFG